MSFSTRIDFFVDIFAKVFQNFFHLMLQYCEKLIHNSNSNLILLVSNGLSLFFAQYYVSYILVDLQYTESNH